MWSYLPNLYLDESEYCVEYCIHWKFLSDKLRLSLQTVSVYSLDYFADYLTSAAIIQKSKLWECSVVNCDLQFCLSESYDDFHMSADLFYER